jgi:preprotein translocase subunit SecG
MTTLHTIVLVVHVLIGAMIVALVLIQRGKGADAGAAFGAGASGTVFGAKGSANFMSRSTAVLAALFFCTSLGLTYLGTQRKAPESMLDAVVPAETAPGMAPTAGAPAAVPAGELPALPGQPAAPAPASAPGAPARGAGADAPVPGQPEGQPGG